MKVLNPKAELKMFRADKAAHDPELLLMNIGYFLGPTAVLNQLGIKSRRDDIHPITELLGNTKQELFGVMELRTKLGLLAAGDPGFSLMKGLMAAEAKYQPDPVDDDARMGLTRLSMDQGAMLTFKRIVTAASEERGKSAVRKLCWYFVIFSILYKRGEPIFGVRDKTPRTGRVALFLLPELLALYRCRGDKCLRSLRGEMSSVTNVASQILLKETLQFLSRNSMMAKSFQRSQ